MERCAGLGRRDAPASAMPSPRGGYILLATGRRIPAHRYPPTRAMWPRRRAIRRTGRRDVALRAAAPLPAEPGYGATRGPT